MTVGQFVSFSTYMMQLTWPIIALEWVINCSSAAQRPDPHQ